MEYLHLFETNNEFQNNYDNNYIKPWISYTKETRQVHYNKPIGANGFSYVDLGLPSGILWATCNVGARSVEEGGWFYSWGEISEKEIYSVETYKWRSGTDYTKYNNIDNKTILDLEDDAAHVIMGGNWKMPNSDQLSELRQLPSVWTTINNVNGRLFTGNNGNTLFVPAAGFKRDSSFREINESAGIWASDLYNKGRVWLWTFDSENNSVGLAYFRSDGFNVRGIIEP